MELRHLHYFLKIAETSSFTLPSLIKPCMQFSRTRLSDILHAKACAERQPAAVGILVSP